MSTTLTTDDGTWQTTAEISEQDRYARYMTSREWSVRKRPIKARSGGICERCKINPSTAVHHISYARKYHEEPEDLQDLCEACHNFLHAKSDEDPLGIPATLTGVFQTGCRIFVFFQKDGSSLPDSEVYLTAWSWTCRSLMVRLMGDDIKDFEKNRIPGRHLLGRKFRIKVGNPEDGFNSQVTDFTADPSRPRGFDWNQIANSFIMSPDVDIDATY